MRLSLSPVKLFIFRVYTNIFLAHVCKTTAWFAFHSLKTRLRGSECLLVTTAFNNPDVLRHQHRLLSRNVSKPHVWLVVDNSSSQKSSRDIRDYCNTHGVAYWRMRFNPYSAHNPSRSHGFALNVAWNRIKNHSRAEIVGFLDHDIFPVSQFSPTDMLERQPVWGRLQEKGGRWYIWPGLMFVQREFAQLWGLDFMPTSWGDTGAANADLLLRELLRDDLQFPAERSVQIRHSDATVYQGDFIDEIDGWIHTINGSYWKPVPSKEDLIADLLDAY